MVKLSNSAPWRSNTLGALFSGVLTAAALSQLNTVLVWICFVPLFTRLVVISGKSAIKAGLYFGLALSLCLFYWMITGAHRFTGTSNLYGLLGCILSSGLLSLYFGILMGAFGYLKQKHQGAGLFKAAINAALISSLFCLGEYLLAQISSGFPWLAFHAGLPLANNQYTIQLAAFQGIYALSFIVILINYLIAAQLVDKNWAGIFKTAVIVLLFHVAGYLLFKDFNKHLPTGKKLKIAILTENIPPDVKWNDQTGNQLAQRLLDMSNKAASLHPDIAVWSESAIPWTYMKDDDLVNAIVHNSTAAGVTNLLGINTQTTENNVVYNSCYMLTPKGEVIGKYDKQILLAIIERPFMGLVMPFMSSAGFIAIAGPDRTPINSDFGKIGVMICNESVSAQLARAHVKNGAEFLYNMSNDGWFHDSYLMRLHFYNARLRAVETRKDMVVNSNLGYGGLIKASGKIELQQISDQPSVYPVIVENNQLQPFAIRYPYLLLYCSLAMVILSIVYRRQPPQTSPGLSSSQNQKQKDNATGK